MHAGFHWRITEESYLRMESDFRLMSSMGLTHCTCGIRIPGFYQSPRSKHFTDVLDANGIDLEVLSVSLGQPTVYDLIEGPITVGFVPPEYREQRYPVLRDAAEFASSIGVKYVLTHFGFIPEDQYDPKYEDVVKVAQKVADICGEFGVTFLFETGEETPTTLLRLLEDAGKPNLKVNLDMANLIAYGKGEPCGAIDVLKDHIVGADAKDSLYPTGGRELGVEVPLGQGRVDLQGAISKLFDIGYDGTISIEREAHTLEGRIEGIVSGKKIVEGLIEIEANKRIAKK